MTERTPTDFERDLESLINRHSQENGSNTPDFILAAYVADCIALFNTTTVIRDAWYGVDLRPGHPFTAAPEPVPAEETR